VPVGDPEALGRAMYEVTRGTRLTAEADSAAIASYDATCVTGAFEALFRELLDERR
jgi:hypothetical protein